MVGARCSTSLLSLPQTIVARHDLDAELRWCRVGAGRARVRPAKFAPALAIGDVAGR